MTRTFLLKAVALVLVSGVGAPNAFASTPAEAENQVATICVAGLTSECVKGICMSVSSARSWAATDQATFGAAVAAMIAKEGAAAPATADKIQNCVARGPAALVAAFEGAGSPIAEIGTQSPASAF